MGKHLHRLEKLVSDEALSRRIVEANPLQLLLDYDGTLAPFVVERDKAVPYPGVQSMLARLMVLPGVRVVVVTGRESRVLNKLLGVAPHPEIWGCHGAERLMADGRLIPAEISSEQRQCLDGAAEAAEARGLGNSLERKATSVALHWRGAVAGVLEGIEGAAREILNAHGCAGLALHRFDGGLELRAEGFDKGRAVRAAHRESGAGSMVIYMGDDLTDEDAFAALAPEDLGVLVRGEQRETKAEAWIVPPQELLAFLGHVVSLRAKSAVGNARG